MKPIIYMQKNIVKFSFALFCCFFMIINVYAVDPDTGQDKSCANKVKTKVTDVTGGITCVYGEWFFYQKKEGDTKVYEPYLLTAELKLAGYVGHNWLPEPFYNDYYAPLEKINGEYSYCMDDNRTVVDPSKGFDGLHTSVTLKSDFDGDRTNIVYFSKDLIDYTPTNNDVRDINKGGNIRDYYAQQFNAGTSKNCPPYLAVSLPAKGVIAANALDQYDDNTLSSLASTNGINFTNYLDTNINGFMSPRSYVIENGKFSGITEVLPLIRNTNQKAGYSLDDMNTQVNEMQELINWISNFDDCSQYPDEASKRLAAIKAKIKSIEMHGFQPKADSQGKYGPGSVSQAFIDKYLTLRSSDDPKYNIFDEPTSKACNFFHKITTVEKMKTLELGEIKLTCENLTDASRKYAQLITKYNEELAYWKDKDATFYSTVLAKKQQVDSEKQQFDNDFEKMTVACKSGDDKAFEEIAKEVEDKMKNDFDALLNIVNEYGMNVGDPKKINCEDFGENFIVTIFRYMTIAGTILLIVFGTIDFAKATLSYDESAIKKAGKSFAKRLIAAVILFLLPLLVGVIMNIGVAAGIFEETPIECFTTTK